MKYILFLYLTFILPVSPTEVKISFKGSDQSKVASVQNHNIVKCNIYKL